MIKFENWYLPAHEKHLQTWMRHPKNALVMNGRQAYQGRKQLAAMKLCTKHRIAVDVGGHVGFHSFNLAHQFQQVHAFEPVAEHRGCFAKNTEGLANIHLHAVALGKEPGSVRIETEHGSSGNSYVGGAGEIPMVTLDSLGLTEVDYIKIDVEGLEENVLRGAIGTITRDRPVVMVEQKHAFSSTRFGLKDRGAVEFLKTLGYKVAEEISGDFLCVCS